VEVAFAPNVVRVRATGIAGVDLVFGRAQWAAFVAAVRAGEFSSRTGR
jgi:hypothetical protein